ncbi:MAG: hypothetical protein AAGF47_06045 [Planctomycetota bacterium]
MVSGRIIHPDIAHAIDAAVHPSGDLPRGTVRLHLEGVAHEFDRMRTLMLFVRGVAERERESQRGHWRSRAVLGAVLIELGDQGPFRSQEALYDLFDIRARRAQLAKKLARACVNFRTDADGRVTGGWVVDEQGVDDAVRDYRLRRGAFARGGDGENKDDRDGVDAHDSCASLHEVECALGIRGEKARLGQEQHAPTTAIDRGAGSDGDAVPDRAAVRPKRFEPLTFGQRSTGELFKAAETARHAVERAAGRVMAMPPTEFAQAVRDGRVQLDAGGRVFLDLDQGDQADERMESETSSGSTED